MSEHTEHKGLSEAMLALQDEAPTLKKAETAKIPTKSGKEFSYKYTDLAAVLGIVRPLLVKHQLQWSTFPTTLDGEPALRYKITHVPTGESEQDVMKLLLASRDAQAQGSGITYSRRYAMIAVLDLAAEDDDGKGASGRREASGAVSSGVTQPSAPPVQQTERPANAKQRGLLNVRASEAGLSRTDFANVILIASGQETREFDSEDAAEQWLKRALDRLPAKLVNPILEEITGLAAAA